jgi:hypothetical protein
MDNKIEILRAICFTSEDMKTVSEIENYNFSEIDIEFMVEFKKIYELGENQLYYFLDKLDCQGYQLDDYSLLYYVRELLSGPFKEQTIHYTKTNKIRYFVKNTPDEFGNNGNKTKTIQNTSLATKNSYRLGVSVDLYNKLPKNIQNTIFSAIGLTESIFRDSLKSSTVCDNTLPIVDKSPNSRCNQEDNGSWEKIPNGTFLNKDPNMYEEISRVSKDIFEKVKKYLKDESVSKDEIKPCTQLPYETWRLYIAKKEYNPFDSEKNQSQSHNTAVSKNIPVGDERQNVDLDILGEEFDSFDRRNKSLKIENEDKNREYKLYASKGQLGS